MVVLSPNQFKCLTCVLVMALGLLGGFLPIKLTHKTNSQDDDNDNDNNDDDNGNKSNGMKKITNSVQSSVVSMFTAGIFFSSALLHFLPEATGNGQLNSFMEEKWFLPVDNNYPWANLFFAMGFLFLMSFEAIANEYQGQHICVQSPILNEEECSCEELLIPNDTLSECTYEGLLIPHDKIVVYDSLEDTGQNQGNQGKMEDSLISYHSPNSTESSSASIESENDNKLQIHDSPKMVSFVAFLSLSFHSIMEGISIGSQPDCDWSILFAIMAHKSLAAFSLGVEFLNHNIDERTYILFMVLFSIMTPLGVLLGWCLTAIFAGQDDSALVGICMALSGGTFLYISVMEIIPHELESRGHVGWKLISLSLGFSAMAILTSFV